MKWIKPQRKELLTLYFIQVFKMQAIILAFLFLLPMFYLLEVMNPGFALAGPTFFS